jgi:hypothetical protein
LKRLAFITFLIVCSIASASAQSKRITGMVTNGTTQKPAAGDDVILIKLGQGMQEETRTKTDARGAFSLTAADGSALHLIRVRHDNVNYHEPVQPGTNNVQITVYNAMAKVPGLKMLDQSEVFQATDNQLQVIELIRISNTANPPVTQPSLDVYLPEGASVKLSQARTENGMSVNATVVPQREEKNKYSIVHPVRPGDTHIELVYVMPYAGKISLQPRLTIPADHFYVVTAKGIKFATGSGSSFQTTGQWPADPSVTGVDIHSVDNVSPEKQLSFELAGSGLLPDQEPAPAQGAQGAGAQIREDNRPGGGLGQPNEKPDPLHSGQWPFLGVLGLFLAAGAYYVYTSGAQPATVAVKKASGQGLLLEAMKEEIFQLETDRLQGKISPQEYESAKTSLDQTLQRAVQRQKSK